MMLRPLYKSFFNSVDVGPAAFCWVWKGRIRQDGYGSIAKRGTRAGHFLAHRISWLLHFGEIPPGLFVLHSCDNPPCVNPHHLGLGTNNDNIRDMIKKRRHHSHKKTACPRGHPYDRFAPRLTKDGSPGIARQCRRCSNAASAKYYAKKRKQK